jgi:DNA-binding response OmpR family regulator
MFPAAGLQRTGHCLAQLLQSLLSTVRRERTDVVKTRKIFVVDDSRTQLQWVTAVLEDSSYEVITRQQSIGTGAAILREAPDLVLLDVMMPGLTGDHIVSSLRKYADSPMRIVLHSSLSAQELEAKADACGADGFICKTTNPVLFLRQVKNVLPADGEQ